ncbi:unnamed protein product [Closterium sp. NIES-54]
MLALCREERMEHRTKHIALRYFLARELQQRGQLRLAYVASEANTADVFTKALAPCDHQRCCTQLGPFWSCPGPAGSCVTEILFPSAIFPGRVQHLDLFFFGLAFTSIRSSSIGSAYVGSSCEAEIYAGAMAAQELRWLTYLLTDLGEQPRSPPVLYIDNKAMLALCREHRLEHRTKHIALRYFLARELQQRGQLRLAYVASEANTADIFTKALALGDHQRFCTMLGFPTSSGGQSTVFSKRPASGTTPRMALAALGFAPSSAGQSLFLRTNATLPPFYILVYIDDLAFAIADTEALALVKTELQERHTCTDLGEMRSYLGVQVTRDRARRTIALTQSHMVHQVLQRFGFQYSSPQPTPLPTGHSISAPPSDESVEPSGPYPELVGCLITSGMGLLLGGQGSVVLIGHSDASWANDQATQRSSLGYTFSFGSGLVSWRSTRPSSWPRSPLVLYVDNKAMLAMCHVQRLEHRMKHNARRYFLAQELQQRVQPRLSYVASRVNTADVFTKALKSGDHQRFCTSFGLLPVLPHLLIS